MNVLHFIFTNPFCKALSEGVVFFFKLLCMLVPAVLAAGMVISIIALVETDTETEFLVQLGKGAIIALILSFGYWLTIRVFCIRNEMFLGAIILGFFAGYYTACVLSCFGLVALYAEHINTGIKTFIGLALTAVLVFCPHEAKKLKRK